MKKIWSSFIICCLAVIFGYSIIQENKVETYQVESSIKARAVSEWDLNWSVGDKVTLDTVINGKPLKSYKATLVYMYNDETLEACDEPEARLIVPEISCEFDGWYYDKDLTQKVEGTVVGDVLQDLYISCDGKACVSNTDYVTKYYYVTEVYAKCKDVENPEPTPEPTPTPEPEPTPEPIVCTDDVDKTFTLTYNIDGEDSSSHELVFGATFATSSAPEKEGYTFNGWYLDAALTKKFNGTLVKNLNPKEKYDSNNCLIGYENVTLYGSYQKNSCDPIEKSATINFETNGGEKISKVIINFDEDNSGKLNIPTKEKNKFEGWYYDKKLTNKVTGTTFDDLKYTYITNDDGCITGYNDITLYAKWSKIDTNPETGDNIIIYCALAVVLIASGTILVKKICRK